MFKQIPYKEDWEAEKQQVYYPVHITPGYEASSDVKKVQSDVSCLSSLYCTYYTTNVFFHLGSYLFDVGIDSPLQLRQK